MKSHFRRWTNLPPFHADSGLVLFQRRQIKCSKEHKYIWNTNIFCHSFSGLFVSWRTQPLAPRIVASIKAGEHMGTPEMSCVLLFPDLFSWKPWMAGMVHLESRLSASVPLVKSQKQSTVLSEKLLRKAESIWPRIINILSRNSAAPWNLGFKSDPSKPGNLVCVFITAACHSDILQFLFIMRFIWSLLKKIHL